MKDKGSMNSARSAGLETKHIHGVETGNHSNPNVVKAARCYQSGGKVAGSDMDDDDMPKARSRSRGKC